MPWGFLFVKTRGNAHQIVTFLLSFSFSALYSEKWLYLCIAFERGGNAGERPTNGECECSADSEPMGHALRLHSQKSESHEVLLLPYPLQK